MTNRLTVVDTFRNSDGVVFDVEKHIKFMYSEQPTSWDDAATRSLYWMFNHSFKSWDKPEDIREYLDYLIGLMGPSPHPDAAAEKKTISNATAAEYWTLFGSIVVSAGIKLGIFKNIENSEDAFRSLLLEIQGILVRKQHDYGHENIARFGRFGILVRCHDKVARMQNLLTGNRTPQNEPLVDTFADLLGYSAIGMMWEKGWFMLPLAEDIPPRVAA